MAFLLAHWHCILPAAAVIAGLLLIRGGKKEERRGFDEPDEKE